MLANKKLSIILVLLILMLVASVFRINQIKRRSIYIGSELKLNTLAEENVKLQERIMKLEELVDMYCKDIRQLHNLIQAPIYLTQGDEERELLEEAYAYIIQNNIYPDSLIFQIGPIRRSSEDEYSIDLYHLRMKELQDVFQDLDNYFPSQSIKFSAINVVISAEGPKYTIGD